MPTKAIINWGEHPYGEALRLSHTNNRYQSMLPPELERLIHSYLYRDDRERRKQVILYIQKRHDQAQFSKSIYYFARPLGRNAIVKKSIPEDSEVLFYTTDQRYVAAPSDKWYDCLDAFVDTWRHTCRMSGIKDIIKEKRRERIKLLGNLPLE